MPRAKRPVYTEDQLLETIEHELAEMLLRTQAVAGMLQAYRGKALEQEVWVCAACNHSIDGSTRVQDMGLSYHLLCYQKLSNAKSREMQKEWKERFYNKS